MCGDDDDNVSRSSKTRVRQNACTDVVFLAIFIAFWCGMIAIASFAIAKGDIKRFIYGYDSYGNTCHSSTNIQYLSNNSNSGVDTYEKDNVMFLDVFDPFDALQICVPTCPKETLITKSQVKAYANQPNGTNLCAYNIPVEEYDKDSTEYGRIGPCPSLPVYRSISILNRCIPDIFNLKSLKLADLANFTRLLDEDDIFRQGLADLFGSWKEMLVLCGVAFVIAFLMLALLRFCTGFVVWIIVALSIISSIVLSIFLWLTYRKIKMGIEATVEKKIPLFNISIKNEKAFLVMAIVATVFSVVLIIVTIAMRNRIALVIALFKEAAKCLISMPLLLIQSLWTFLAIFVFLVYWFVIAAFIFTSGEPVMDTSKGFERIKFVPMNSIRYLAIYHFIGLIWTCEFIIACQHLIVSGAVTSWYFTRERSVLDCQIGKATCRLVQHHLGTAALGSFIITLCKIPRYILMYIQRRYKDSQSAVAQFILKCLICCLYCLEKFLKYLNQNAYTIVAIRGINFCSAAQKAFQILVSNVLRVAAINSIGSFVLFLGKIGIMMATGAVSVIWFRDRSDLNYFMIPVGVVSILALLIGHCFMNILKMIVDCLLLCFCEDCNMNDGSPGREYYMSAELMALVKGTSHELGDGNRSRGNSRTRSHGEYQPASTTV